MFFGFGVLLKILQSFREVAFFDKGEEQEDSCQSKSGIHVEHGVALCDGSIVLPGIVEDRGAVRSNDQRERIQLPSAFALGQCLFEAPLPRKIFGIPLVRGGVARVELNGAPKLPFRRLPVVIIVLRDQRQGRMRFREGVVDLQCPQRSATCLGHKFILGNQIPCAHQSKSVRQAGVSTGVVWILVDRFLKILGGLLKTL